MTAKTKRKPKAPGAKARPRKPRRFSNLNSDIYAWADWTYNDGEYEFAVGAEWMSPTDARKMAAWLLKAADWADAQAARRKGGK